MKAGSRDPDGTRETLLQAAYQEVHHRGFRGASLTDILARAGMTKGAMYHHFVNKQALGYALVEELLAEEVLHDWINPVEAADNPIDGLQEALRVNSEKHGPELITLGCPLNNLAQEMSSIDEGFRLRLNKIFDDWLQGISRALARGQQRGQVKEGLNVEELALVLLAGLEGCVGLSKNNQSLETLAACGRGLALFLESLRP